jgi:hypothetical protein
LRPRAAQSGARRRGLRRQGRKNCAKEACSWRARKLPEVEVWWTQRTRRNEPDHEFSSNRVKKRLSFSQRSHLSFGRQTSCAGASRHDSCRANIDPCCRGHLL